MRESSVESKIISFAQNFFQNSLNQSVIRDHLGNCSFNNCDCLRGCPEGSIYNNIQEGYDFCNNNGCNGHLLLHVSCQLCGIGKIA